jgi:flagellar biosynthesis anti-sigma factor FlgM
MKINDSQLNSVTTAAQQAEQAGSTQATRAGASPKADSRGDAVQLSGLSSTLQALAHGGPQQEARVASLSAEYQGGNYRVNAAAVGKQIVSEAFEPH